MKATLCTTLGILGSAVASAFGGWNEGLTTLIIFMSVDYLTGLLVAGVFHRSEKTENGGLESRAGWKGLTRKGVTLLIVLIACRLDILLGETYIRDTTVVGFCVNEMLSIVENAGLMGIPLPKTVIKAIEVLKHKADQEVD